jgi:hypothetical protein
MGTWGIGSFDNDGAVDWIMDFAEEQSLAKLHSAFRMVSDENGTIESIDAEEAIVAAEVCAALRGNVSIDFPDEELVEITREPLLIPNELITTSIKCINSILSKSELKELWEETADFDNWNEDMKELRDRLQACLMKAV